MLAKPACYYCQLTFNGSNKHSFHNRQHNILLYLLAGSCSRKVQYSKKVKSMKSEGRYLVNHLGRNDHWGRYGNIGAVPQAQLWWAFHFYLKGARINHYFVVKTTLSSAILFWSPTHLHTALCSLNYSKNLCQESILRSRVSSRNLNMISHIETTQGASIEMKSRAYWSEWPQARMYREHVKTIDEAS